MLNLFNGIQIIETTSVPVFQNTPVKTHRVKKWMSQSYKLRIQKKWNKRFGITRERAVVFSAGTVFCHPDNAMMIKMKLRTA